MTATRSTLRAATIKVDHNLTAEPVVALLADVRTIADADALAPILDRRLADASAAREAHGQPDPLSDDAAQDAHATAAAPLDREVTRCAAAVERLAGLRADLVSAGVRADAEQKVADGRTAADEAEAAAADYAHAARAVAASLDRLRAAQVVVEAGRRVGRENGLDVTGLLLPHERRSSPEEWTQDEVIERGIRRRIDRRVRSSVVAADLASARIELPAIDGGAPIVSQGRR